MPFYPPRAFPHAYPLLSLVALTVLFFPSLFCASAAQAQTFRAGASAIDITPPKFPVRVNGMFTERSADKAVDPLYARSMALDDGQTQLVFCIVDTCMMEEGLIDTAKEEVTRATGLATDRMMVSATHTHSAPSAMACLGSRQDPDYAAWLPGKLAASMIAALEALRPARIGWASVDDWAHTHNRRWIRRADKTFADPFGDMTVRAHMHPGYESVDVIGPSGPVDPELSILVAETLDGEPIALLGNYSQHYYRSPLLSADYYGAFARHMAAGLGQPSGEGPFVAMMSQGTSGDLMWMDYGSPRNDGNFDDYAREVAERALEAYRAINWHDHAPLAMAERRLTLDYRVPDADRLAWARERVDALGDALPQSKEDIYAHEAVILHERQETPFKLQAIRIGDLTIATLPNEVYALTGLKLKAQAPLGAHFNIGLANGSVGYIPPPEQHELGGYTTWPARTAGLEVQAEPTIVAALLKALEDVADAPRAPVVAGESVYSNAVKALKPDAYWRLEEMAGRIAASAIGGGPEATLSGGAALYLPGPGSGTGWGDGEQLKPSNFSAPDGINRAVHFVADGRLTARLPKLAAPHTVAFWFWLGEQSGASLRSGRLLTLTSGDYVRYTVNPAGMSHVYLVRKGDPGARYGGRHPLPIGGWHFAAVVDDGTDLHLYIDGEQAEPEATRLDALAPADRPLVFAEGLEGKLDEIAVFNRILSTEERRSLWNASGMAEINANESAREEQTSHALAARSQAPDFPEGYAGQLRALGPRIYTPLNAPIPGLEVESGFRLTRAGFAAVNGGRLRGTFRDTGDDYSVSLWFKNTIPNNIRAVTAYLFSRGPDADVSLTGDHLGIGGTFRDDLEGKLLLFNGNTANTEAAGKTTIPPDTWNHVVLVRRGNHASAWLNGVLEIDTELLATTNGASTFFLGSRSDNYAPLSGYLAHFALFDRPLTAEEAKRIFQASGRPVGIPDAPAAPAPQLEAQALTPEAGRESIRVPEGFTVDLVASEPTVLDPVAFDWDTRGRLWVVEMADYPMGMDGEGKPGGRVRVLEDRDGDGVYEHGRQFAEGLNFPTGILTWRDGVIVTAAPDILFLRDTTGDGQADVREVLLTGLSEGNQQLRANGLRWGLDNWVYVAAGGHHGKYALDTKLHSTRAGTDTVIGSRDFRFNPDTGVVEPQSGPTQFGRNRDDWGHWFGTQNSRPLWHYALPDHYLKRNPYLAAPDGTVQVLGEVGPPVYPASALQKRFHDFKASGRFTSACSGMIYRDDVLFPADSLNGFACEPFHNVVQRITLAHDEVTFTGTRAGAPEAPDFFASTDRWCRPVMVRTGPDGGLWVADMYRYMIEHPQWLPPEGKAELLPFYRKGDDRGRLYRIRPENKAPSPIPVLEGMDNRTLALHLASPNGWVRDKAQQLLIWRDARDAENTLLHLLSESGPRGYLHALCTLDGLGLLKPPQIIAALDHGHPGIRENALRLAERHGTPEIVAAACGLVKDPDPKVRQQLAFSLGAMPPSLESATALADVLLQNHDDTFIRTAALSSALPHQSQLIGELLARSDPAIKDLRLTLADMALSADDITSVERLIAPVFERAARDLPEVAESIAQILDLLKRRDTSINALAAGQSDGTLGNVAKNYVRLVEDARGTISNDEAGDTIRMAAATVLSRIPEETSGVVTFLANHLSPHAPPEAQHHALEILAHTNDTGVAELVLGAWSGFTPTVREHAADVLLGRVAWTRALLDAIPTGTVRPTDLRPVRRTQLLNHPDKELRTLASERLDIDQNPDRAKVVAAYRPSLRLDGEAARGRAKFEELCAACHRLGDVGANVGPDLRTVLAHPKEKLLANILDPNLDIQPGYHAYNCELENGEQLFGIITAENATSITMKLSGDQERTILRNDIFALESTTISMMPDGLEAGITPQEMANLLAFIKSGG